MPNVQKTKFNKGSLLALAIIAAIIGVSFLPFEFWIKLCIQIALVLLFVFLRRGYIYFYRGAMAFKKKDKDPDKVWRYMEKALKAGVDMDRRVTIGSAYVQAGDTRRGIEILEAVMRNKKVEGFAQTATITCSMAYWKIGERQKAIDVLEDLKATGYRNDNLTINLETYHLAEHNLKTVKELISEHKKENVENNGLMDNRGWYYIQTGNWSKAKEVYDELINDRNANFPEAYLHGAQVSVHEGNVGEAIDRLGWGISKRFLNITFVTRQYMEQILSGLENPKTREAYMSAMDKAYVDISCGLEFDGFDSVEAFDENAADVIKPAEKKAVVAQAKEISTELNDSDESEAINTDVDDDDREPNTDLDDEDIAYAHDLEVEENGEPEDEPDLSLDDDDDREPNTDLDEDE